MNDPNYRNNKMKWLDASFLHIATSHVQWVLPIPQVQEGTLVYAHGKTINVSANGNQRRQVKSIPRG